MPPPACPLVTHPRAGCRGVFSRSLGPWSAAWPASVLGETATLLRGLAPHPHLSHPLPSRTCLTSEKLRKQRPCSRHCPCSLSCSQPPSQQPRQPESEPSLLCASTGACSSLAVPLSIPGALRDRDVAQAEHLEDRPNQGEEARWKIVKTRGQWLPFLKPGQWPALPGRWLVKVHVPDTPQMPPCQGRIVRVGQGPAI